MRTSPLTLTLALLLAGCAPDEAAISWSSADDCDPCDDGSDDGGSDPGDDDGSDDGGSDPGNDDGGSSSSDSDLSLYVGTPGGGQVATMFVHAEFLTDSDAEFGGWTWTGRYAWTNGVELGFNPGMIDGVRWNATYCSVETEDESHSSCSNWLAYGQNDSEAHLTATTYVIYFDVSYDVDLVSFCWDGDGNGSEESCGSSAISEF